MVGRPGFVHPCAPMGMEHDGKPSLVRVGGVPVWCWRCVALHESSRPTHESKVLGCTRLGTAAYVVHCLFKNVFHSRSFAGILLVRGSMVLVRRACHLEADRLCPDLAHSTLPVSVSAFQYPGGWICRYSRGLLRFDRMTYLCFSLVLLATFLLSFPSPASPTHPLCIGL